jgi:uncharacterized protein (TIGR01777 family)
MKNKKIIIAGGTGFIGMALAKYFSEENNITILTRNLNHPANNTYGNSTTAIKNVTLVKWNGKDIDDWCKEINNADILINLTGKSVNCRYTEKNKQKIFDSRTTSTKILGEAIKQSINPPKIWLNAASATIYRNATDKPQDEYSLEFRNDFSVQVCKLWEKTFFEQSTPNTRKIALRMAITLGMGGVIIPYLNLCKFGLGGKQASGNQMFSWIHIEDVCRAVEFLIEKEDIEGAYNLSSPNPVTNKVFMKTLREVTHTKIGLPAYKWMLKLGAFLIGTETELILKSRWVVPTKLLQLGFKFKHPQLKEAFENIITKLPKKKYSLF